jgi:hypothetical protein
MKKKVVMVCMLMTSICSLYAQNVTLAPEMGISAVQRVTILFSALTRMFPKPTFAP